MVELEEKPSRYGDDDSAVGVPDSSDSTETVTVGDYAKVWDADYGVWYFVSNSTGESYWEVEVDGSGLWMEVLDEATQYYYYLHAETGESIWAEEASEVIADGSAAATDEGYDTSAAPALVWEETTDPLSGWTYYYSHANGVSQWAPPAWMDYVDAESGSVYYLHLESGESSWEKPLDFVAEAWDDSDLYDWSNEEDGGYGSSTGNGLDGGTTSGSASGDGEESSAMPGADLSPTPPPAADPITAAALPTPPTPPPPVEAPLSPVPSAPPMEEEFEEAMLEVSPSPSFGLPPPAYDTVASASDPSIVGSTSSARREAAAGAPAAPAAEQDRRGAGIASGVRHDKSMDVEEPLASSRAATAHVPPSSAPRNAVAKRGPPWAANDPSSGGPFGTSSSSSGRIESEVSSASNGPGYALSKRPRGKQPGLAAYPLRGGAILSPEQPPRGTNHHPHHHHHHRGPPPLPPPQVSSSRNNGVPPPPAGRSTVAAAYLRAAAAGQNSSSEGTPPAATASNQTTGEGQEGAAAVLPPTPPTATTTTVAPFPPAPPPSNSSAVQSSPEEGSNEMDEAH